MLNKSIWGNKPWKNKKLLEWVLITLLIGEIYKTKERRRMSGSTITVNKTANKQQTFIFSCSRTDRKLVFLPRNAPWRLRSSSATVEFEPAAAELSQLFLLFHQVQRHKSHFFLQETDSSSTSLQIRATLQILRALRGAFFNVTD